MKETFLFVDVFLRKQNLALANIWFLPIRANLSSDALPYIYIFSVKLIFNFYLPGSRHYTIRFFLPIFGSSLVSNAHQIWQVFCRYNAWNEQLFCGYLGISGGGPPDLLHEARQHKPRPFHALPQVQRREHEGLEQETKKFIFQVSSCLWNVPKVNDAACPGNVWM